MQSRFTFGRLTYLICTAVVQPRFFATRSAARWARRWMLWSLLILPSSSIRQTAAWRCGTPPSDSLCSQTVYLLLARLVWQERTFPSLPVNTCLSNSAAKSCQSLCQSSMSKKRVCSAEGLSSILITEFLTGLKRDKVSCMEFHIPIASGWEGNRLSTTR